MTTAGDLTQGVTRRRMLAMAVGGAAAAVVVRPSIAQAEPRSSPGGVAGEWFDQTAATAAAFNPPVYPPGVADRIWAIGWMSAFAAMHDARRASPEAAVAAAVHGALAVLAPDQVSRLDQALARSLSAIPDSAAKQAGIRAGRDAASRVLADRTGDGLDPVSLSAPFTPPPPAPGVYRLPPGATRTMGYGLSKARPFLLDRSDRFRPGPPPGLSTDRYLRDLRELRDFGGAVSQRSALQDDIAWLAPQMQYLPALEGLVRGPGRSVRWKVALLAAYSVATLDAQIAVSEAKFTYLHWRPITAIRLTDPDWSSYLPTPANPEYPSAHAVIAGAAERVLGRFTGPVTPVPITATIVRGDGHIARREYHRGSRWTALTRDNIDARVWAGVHWRFSDEIGAATGRHIGTYTLNRLAGHWTHS